MGLFIILGVFMLLSLIIGQQLKSRFRKYAKLPVSGGLSGKEVAEKMLYDNGIYDVRVISVPGQLSDHYNPVKKTINLSHDVYYGRNVSAAAVAAHETGHAVQHATSYTFLNLRSALVPLQNISGKIINIIFISMFLGAFLLPMMIPFDLALMVIIACYAVFTLFAFITLPVEFNASQRALAWLNTGRITNDYTHRKAKDALNWAAMTYVVAALSSLATLLYYVAIFMGRSE